MVDGVVTTPCARCKASGLECVIGGSNRGGRRVRRKTIDSSFGSEGASEQAGFLEQGAGMSGMGEGGGMAGGPPGRRYDGGGAFEMAQNGGAGGQSNVAAALMIDPALQSADVTTAAGAEEGWKGASTRESSTGAAGITFNDLQNPSDALGILAQIASNGQNAPSTSTSHMLRPGMTAFPENQVDYALVRNGKLSIQNIVSLLESYRWNYHPFFPLVPAATLDPANIARTAREEPHLLTAVLVIASRDLTDEPSIFMICSEHMRSLVSGLAAGGTGNVEAVEALLVLAEWTPYTSRSDAGHVGRGEEDREAWMHVGMALRVGYYLGLDRYSFAVRGDDAKDPQWQRKRLVWTSCYISDRQISIRLGRAFWSRGPGPLTTLRKEDFPMLAPAKPGDEDFASIFQATLELTLLFSNVHDVLYSNPGNSMRSHLSGGYIKYIDDFRSAIYGWKSVWSTLTCSPDLKTTLLMSYDYLRLYTNAFAFHATVKRALPQMQDHAKQSNPAPGRVFYNNVGAVGDARFIYEGLDAAKSLLSMFNTFVDPEKSLRFMPLRFYLYSVYSGVFLYRARSVGVFAADEEQSVKQMVYETINRLERSGIGSQHPGSRYSQLLKLLWDKVDRKDRKNQKSSTATLTNPYRPGSVGGGGPTPASNSGLTQDSPAVTEMMGDFSWTDLDAIGNFAVNGNGGSGVGDVDFWSGFLPEYSGSYLFEGLGDMDLQWNVGM